MTAKPRSVPLRVPREQENKWDKYSFLSVRDLHDVVVDGGQTPTSDPEHVSELVAELHDRVIATRAVGIYREGDRVNRVAGQRGDWEYLALSRVPATVSGWHFGVCSGLLLECSANSPMHVAPTAAAREGRLPARPDWRRWPPHRRAEEIACLEWFTGHGAFADGAMSATLA